MQHSAKQRRRVVGAFLSAAASAVLWASPAIASTPGGVPGAPVEDHFRQAVSQWTDCPAHPRQLPLTCLGVVIGSWDQRSRVADFVRSEDTVEADLYHVRITGGGVRVDDAPFASGVGPGQIVVGADGRTSITAAVRVADGTIVRARLSYVPVGAADIQEGSAEVGRPDCQSGQADVEYRVANTPATVSGDVVAHGHSDAATSAVIAPFLLDQRDHGACV